MSNKGFILSIDNNEFIDNLELLALSLKTTQTVNNIALIKSSDIKNIKKESYYDTIITCDDISASNIYFNSPFTKFIHFSSNFLVNIDLKLWFDIMNNEDTVFPLYEYVTDTIFYSQKSRKSDDFFKLLSTYKMYSFSSDKTIKELLETFDYENRFLKYTYGEKCPIFKDSKDKIISLKNNSIFINNKIERYPVKYNNIDSNEFKKLKDYFLERYNKQQEDG